MAADGSDLSRWFLRPEPHDAAPLRLLCVPHAGGGPAAFHGWAQALGPGVEPWLLRLPGRESRLGEPPLTRIDAIVRAVAPVCAAYLREPFAVFGYSVGAWIGYELVRELRRHHDLRASHLGVAARPAPHVPLRHPPVHRLPDEEFVDALDRQFRAIPATLREAPEMMRLYLPTLRADTTALETYRHRPGPPLDCPISAFGGSDDQDCPEEELRAWGEHTTAAFRMTMLPGGHFFLNEQRAALVGGLAADLLTSLVP